MILSEYTQSLLPSIEDEIKTVVEQAKIPEDGSLHSMLSYHLGWTGPGASPQSQGKRIRPLLLLLTTIANQGDWKSALPAAAVVELIHNFSLIHDDIEDNSIFRRGRETLWTLHGVPLALNAGDSMFSLAYAALARFSDSVDPKIITLVYKQLSKTCLILTQGQHQDLSFESQEYVPVERYIQMIHGKTAALFSAATQFGALIAGKDQSAVEKFRLWGFNLGIAFQIQDDLLGIWGDEALTGKSTTSDLIARKKTLPILYGLEQNGKFLQAWNNEVITPENSPHLAELLKSDGAYAYTQGQAEKYTQLALSLFNEQDAQNTGFRALEALALKMLGRAS